MHTCIINLCFKCAVSSFYVHLFSKTLKAKEKYMYKKAREKFMLSFSYISSSVVVIIACKCKNIFKV